MIETYLGEIIKKNRELQGLSQEKLCTGICSVPTLSRIENEGKIPSRDRATALLQRLGLSADRYYMMVSKYDADIDKLETEIVSCNIRSDRVKGLEKAQAKKQGREKLHELEKIASSDDPITQQFILRARVILGKEDGDYCLDEQLLMLTEAIGLTVPKFDLAQINHFRYSLEEIKIISQIASCYAKTGGLKKSLTILEQLFCYVQEHNKNMNQSAGQLPLVACNYATKLDLAKRYDDALEVAKIGKQSCVDYGTYLLLPNLLHIIAECWYFLGSREKSLDYYMQSNYLYKAIGNEHNRALLLSEVQDYLSITLDS